MEIEVTNLRAQKAKDGRIFVYFTDGRLSEYKMMVQIISGADFVSFETEAGTIAKVMV
jgi:hypothetical protein